MTKNNTTTYFYKDKPLFGLDIGYRSIKIMQIDFNSHTPTVVGYGVGEFDASSIKDGVIVNPEVLAAATKELFENGLVGDITARRVAIGIPSARTFDRSIKLPKLEAKDIADAVRTEAEQYIPVPIDELYLDYEIVRQTSKEIELFATGVPKKIINSYKTFVSLIGLDPVAMETSTQADTRAFVVTDRSDVPTVLIDFGSLSTDITIYDKTVVITGTVKGGGDDFTNRVAEKLGLTHKEAHTIKTKYGLSPSKKQGEILAALTPNLALLFKEIKRMIRYYEERYDEKRKIDQIITLGGGANMPGLSEYMTNNLRLAVRMADPWHYLNFGRLQPPSTIERSLFITVAGLAMMKPREIFS